MSARPALTTSPCDAGKTGSVQDSGRSAGRRNGEESSSAHMEHTSGATASSRPEARYSASTTAPIQSQWLLPTTTTGAHKSEATTRTVHSTRRHLSVSCPMRSRVQRRSRRQISKRCSKSDSTTGPVVPAMQRGISCLTGATGTHPSRGRLHPGCIPKLTPSPRLPLGRLKLADSVRQSGQTGRRTPRSGAGGGQGSTNTGRLGLLTPGRGSNVPDFILSTLGRWTVHLHSPLS